MFDAKGFSKQQTLTAIYKLARHISRKQLLRYLGSMTTNPYTVLGLDRRRDFEEKLTEQEIKNAYKEALLRCHPDKQRQSCHGNDQTSVDEIKASYLMLLDPEKCKRLELDSSEKTGYINTVDLDDMIFNEGRLEYSLACRCGSSFIIQESDLELDCDIVQCGGCTTKIKIEYVKAEDIK